MAKTEQLLDDLGRLTESWRGAKEDTSALGRIRAEFCVKLEQLRELGWEDALGELNELPDEELPDWYRQQRTKRFESLESQLADLATEYRSCAESSETQTHVVEKYSTVLKEMFRIGHWSGYPDPDSELPADLMPQIYKDFKAGRLRLHREAREKKHPG